VNDIWSWRLRLLEARILVSRSQPQEALVRLQLAPPQTLSSSEIPEQRKLYQGIAHRLNQQFLDAEHDFAEAQELVGPLSATFQAQLLIARAALWVDEKKYQQAEADYRRALDEARRSSSEVLEANSLADLARLATLESHFDQALDLYSSAQALAERLKMKGNISTILGNLGWSYFELGDFEASLDFYKKGAEASARNGLSGYSAYWFSGVANAYLALHDYPSAEKLAEDTLQSAREMKNAQTITTTLNTLTDITLRTGRLKEAERYNQEAMGIEQSGQDRLGVEDSVFMAGQIACEQADSARAEKYFVQLLNDSTAAAPLRWGAEAGLARVREMSGKTREADALYRAAIDMVEQARQSIEHDELRLSFLSSGIGVYGQYLDFLLRQRRSEEALKLAELSRARTLEEGLSSEIGPKARSLTAMENPKKLAARLGSTLLVYWLGEKRSYVWVVKADRAEVVSLPPAGQIEPLVKAYRKAQVDGRDVLRSPVGEGQKLYELLVGGARKLIPPGSRVVVLPDGALYTLNFETLIVPEPKPHFWIEDVTISTANSLTLLASGAAKPHPPGKGLLLVGDTIEASVEFPSLPQAREEITLVQKHFEQVKRRLLTKAEATPAGYLRSHPEQYAYIHFVTHGTASRTRPLESAVILSPEQDAYKLYARDILTRRLEAQLVTISACNGSGTRAYSGEGLVGLSWAFLRTGAHNVIGALWEVSDTATPKLMDRLYSGIAMGQDPATALRNAKLGFVHSGNVYAKPFYWAPFQLYSGS
jgi:CHAT domain-containing protein